MLDLTDHFSRLHCKPHKRVLQVYIDLGTSFLSGWTWSPAPELLKPGLLVVVWEAVVSSWSVIVHVQDMQVYMDSWFLQLGHKGSHAHLGPQIIILKYF